MKEILDEDLIIKSKAGLFSKLSFANALATCALLIIGFLNTPSTIHAQQSLRFGLSENFTTVLLILIFTGGILTLISVNRKEVNHWIKWTGSIINTFFFALLVLSTIF